MPPSRPRAWRCLRALHSLAAAACLPVVLLGACDPPGGAGAAPDAGPSPNASIIPAPLADDTPQPDDAGAMDAAPPLRTGEDGGGRLSLSDAGPPPEAMRPDRALPVEAPSSKDYGGVTLEAAWRWRDVPSAPKSAETSADGHRDAAKLTGLLWRIDLADAGRMRIQFASRALPLPERSEIRGRSDRWGHVVLWPNGTDYRVLAPGALRTALGERRVDVTPLSQAAGVAQGEGKRLGVSTRKVELASSLGSVKLELGKSAEAGEGGALFCRALVEIAGIDPRTAACQPGEVPLLATYSWSNGGGVTLEVTSMTRRTDLVSSEMLVPPPGATFATTGLPDAPSGIFLTADELRALRTAPLPGAAIENNAPGEGFIAQNHGDTLLYFLLDGIPVVAVPQGAERYVIGPQRGRYLAQWRTFLGERIYPAHPVDLPARLAYGTPDGDAGAPAP
ncbi:MAG: hypothetical protein WKG00_09130 [Polyangiaceae bacterium]